jgi:hypothetical protein
MNTGSTRLFVYKVVENLRHSAIQAEINGNFFTSDIVILQKSKPILLLKYLKKAQISGRYVVYVIDDYHDDVYNRMLLKNADCIAVTTSYLKEQYSKYNANIIVIDTVVDVKDVNVPLRSRSNFSKIGWFGTYTNLDALTAKNIKEPVVIISNPGRVDKIWNYDTIDAELQALDLILIPQLKTPIGFAKTNTRMLKCLYLGVPVIVSDMPEYVKLAELVHYPLEFVLGDGADWNETISELRCGKIKFDFNFEECRSILHEYYGIKPFMQRYIGQIMERYRLTSSYAPELALAFP